MPMNRWGAVLVLLCAVLAGCGPCAAVRCSAALTLGPEPGAHIPGALEATARQFLGPAPLPGGGGGGGGGGIRLPLTRDTLRPGSGTPQRVLARRSLGLRLEAAIPLITGLEAAIPLITGREAAIPHGSLPRVASGFPFNVASGFPPDVASGSRLDLTASLALRAGQSLHLLPQGLGPLADPTRIGFTSVTLAPEVGLAWTRPLGRGAADLTLRLSAGHEVSRVRTTVRSALLDVTSHSTQSQRYAALGAGLVLRPAGRAPQVEMVVQARQLPGGARLVLGELRLQRRQGAR